MTERLATHSALAVNQMKETITPSSYNTIDSAGGGLACDQAHALTWGIVLLRLTYSALVESFLSSTGAWIRSFRPLLVPLIITVLTTIVVPVD